MSEARKIGFDRKIALEWLDAVAAKVGQGASETILREYLWSFLEGSASGTTTDGARRKTITVLKGIWCTVPPHLVDMRDRSLAVLMRSDVTERVGVHWAMALVTYPYFASIAETVGRLFAVQGECTALQLAKRMKAVWGDRELVSRTTRHVARSMVDWGAMISGPRIGEYHPRPSRICLSAEVQLLLAEAVLRSAESESIQISDLNRHPTTFPFVLNLNSTQVHATKELSVHREAGHYGFALASK